MSILYYTGSDGYTRFTGDRHVGRGGELAECCAETSEQDRHYFQQRAVGDHLY